MSEITVKEVNVLRKALERDIQVCIASFESITGCVVTSVYVSRVNATDMDSPSRKSVLTGIEISTAV